jgi:hypothetical protein
VARGNRKVETHGEDDSKYIEIYWKEKDVIYWNIPSVSYSGTYVIDWLLQAC